MPLIGSSVRDRRRRHPTRHSEWWYCCQFPGKPSGDASTWAGEHGFVGRKTITLNGPLAKGSIVTVISTDSPRFHLSNGLRVGSSLHRMRAAFPDARPVETYDDRISGHHVRWDEVRRGLDWWTVGGRVVEIGVRRPGSPKGNEDT